MVGIMTQISNNLEILSTQPLSTFNLSLHDCHDHGTYLKSKSMHNDLCFAF